MDLLPSNRWMLGINGISHLDCKYRNLRRLEENFGEGNLSEGKSEIKKFSLMTVAYILSYKQKWLLDIYPSQRWKMIGFWGKQQLVMEH